MSSYKLIQDIEADDKLLGPLSFRQFVYALIAVFMLYMSYLLYFHHAGLLDIVTLPIALFAGFLAYPFGKDQPTEIWAIAKLRFFIKPRRRVWTQSGVKELVTITVPKKIEVQRTNGLSQTEVKSRLQVLANTIDSRGWAIKNVSNVFQNPLLDTDDSDRLISTSSLPTSVPDYDVLEADDLFDGGANPIAQQVDQLLSANTSQHHQQLIDNLNAERSKLATKAPIVISQPINTTTDDQPVNEEAIESKLKNAYKSSRAPLNNMHALRDKLSTPPIGVKAAAPGPKSTTDPNAVIMNLSQRNDLNVSVISHEANKAKDKDASPDEVLISLH